MATIEIGLIVNNTQTIAKYLDSLQLFLEFIISNHHMIYDNESYQQEEINAAWADILPLFRKIKQQINIQPSNGLMFDHSIYNDLKQEYGIFCTNADAVHRKMTKNKRPTKTVSRQINDTLNTMDGIFIRLTPLFPEMKDLSSFLRLIAIRSNN